MEKKRVLMLSNHPLLVHGVESLLRQAEGVEISGRELNTAAVIAGIREQCPDVIILDDRELNGELVLAIMSALGERLGIRVIGLSLQQNTICMYSGEQRQTRGVEDLINAIAPPHNGDLNAPQDAALQSPSPERSV